MQRFAQVQRAADVHHDLIQAVGQLGSFGHDLHHSLHKHEETSRGSDHDDQAGERNYCPRRSRGPPIADEAHKRPDQHRQYEGDDEWNQDGAKEIQHRKRRGGAGQDLRRAARTCSHLRPARLISKLIHAQKLNVIRDNCSVSRQGRTQYSF